MLSQVIGNLRDLSRHDFTFKLSFIIDWVLSMMPLIRLIPLMVVVFFTSKIVQLRNDLWLFLSNAFVDIPNQILLLI